jgi:hypothetical protein
MTLLELADTAIKIGLGALIAGTFALLSSRRQHGHELERERMKRRERVLEKVAEELELAYQGLSAKYERVRALANVVRDARYRPNAQDILCGIEDFARVHIIEARLHLLGLRAEAEMMMQFRHIAGQFEKLALPEDQAHPDPQILSAHLETLFQQRVAIYRRLAEFYDDPRKTGS